MRARAIFGYLVSIALTVAVTCLSARAADATAARKLPTEEMKYKVTSWVGDTADLTVCVSPQCKTDGGSLAQLVTYKLNTIGVMSGIYIINGYSSVLLDDKTLLPYEYDDNFLTGIAITGGTLRRYKLVYDRDKSVIKYFKADEDSEVLLLKQTRKIPASTSHFASIAYLMRYRDTFTVGESIRLPVSDRRKDYTVVATVLREEDYPVSEGVTAPTYVLKVTSDFGKNEVKGSVLTVWLDKREHYPLRIDAKTGWGTISAKLVKRTVTEDNVPANENGRNNPS